MFRRKSLLLAIVALVASFVIGTLVLAVAGLSDDIDKADVCLVLGSKVEPNGTPSARLRARLDRTLELYRAGYFPTIIASGGFRKEGYDEAVVMRDYLVAQGVPPEHVIVDSGGVTTYASARDTLRICRDRQFKSVFVVSQYFHVPRSRLALRRFGMARVYSAHAHLFELRDLYSAPRELIGYVSYLFRSYDPEMVTQP